MSEDDFTAHVRKCRYDVVKKEVPWSEGIQLQSSASAQAMEENYRRLKLVVARAVEATQSETGSRETWNNLREAQEELKRTQPLRRDQRDELWKFLQKGFENENRKREKQQEKWERESAENLRHVQRAVDQACRLAGSGNDFHEAFNGLKEAQRTLRETRPLRREDRDPLFASIQRGFEILKERRDAYQREKKRQYEERQRERARKQEEWRRRQRDRMGKLGDVIRRMEDSIQRDTDYAKDIRRKIDNIRPGRKAVEISTHLKRKLDDVLGRRWSKLGKLQDMRRELRRMEEELGKSQ